MTSYMRLRSVPFNQANPDFAIGNKVSRSIYGQSNLRLQSEQSTSAGRSFRLVTMAGFRFSFHLSELVPDYIMWSASSAHTLPRVKVFFNRFY